MRSLDLSLRDTFDCHRILVEINNSTVKEIALSKDMVESGESSTQSEEAPTFNTEK